MVLTKTPICNFGDKAHSFELKGVDDKIYNFENFVGKKGTLIMFICNHCPYVKAVIKDIVDICKSLEHDGLNSIAIMSNDTENYPEDSFHNMKIFSKQHNFCFPYLYDQKQLVAKKYGAVCTPDFFGYNNKLELQYRGRIKEMKDLKPVKESKNDLLDAMQSIIKTGKGPLDQVPSMGCNIKWIK